LAGRGGAVVRLDAVVVELPLVAAVEDACGVVGVNLVASTTLRGVVVTAIVRWWL
jgi:hypothetical protein